MTPKEINFFVVESGLAWHYKEYEDEKSEADRLLYNAGEKKARGTSVGLRKQANAVKPSDFRTQNQERADAERLGAPASPTAPAPWRRYFYLSAVAVRCRSSK